MCTSWRQEGCVEWKLWVSLIRIFLTVQANVQDLLGGTRTGENAFQCHMNVTFPLLLHTLCKCPGSPGAAAWAALPALCPGDTSAFPLRVALGKEAALSFLGRLLHKQPQQRCCAAKLSFPFQDGENSILILTSAWPLRQCGSGFCPGEIRRDKNTMVYTLLQNGTVL